MSEIRPGWERIHERSLDCVHCGLCLSSCPTYRETGSERSSPRGRIYLMRGVAEERLPLTATVEHEAFLCLGCRACETACPSGVRFGDMLEQARHRVDEAGLRAPGPRFVERFALRNVVARPSVLRIAIDLLAGAQRLGLTRVAQRLLPEELGAALALLPKVPSRRQRTALPELTPAEGTRRGRVAFLSGCVMHELFAEVNRATVRVLARNGFEVVVPRDQGCCGALHAHAGDMEAARGLARDNLRAFDPADVDAVISNSAGCGAALRDTPHWLGEEAEPFASAARDVCTFLDAEGLAAPLGAVLATCCYDDPCHLVHGQGEGGAPRRLLAQVPGLRVVPHANPASCCGAAGTYNLTHPDMSRAVLDRKMEALGAADPDLIVTGNPGCMMQIRSGVARAGLRAEVLHPVTLLDRAHAAAEAERVLPAQS